MAYASTELCFALMIFLSLLHAIALLHKTFFSFSSDFFFGYCRQSGELLSVGVFEGKMDLVLFAYHNRLSRCL